MCQEDKTVRFKLKRYFVSKVVKVVNRNDKLFVCKKREIQDKVKRERLEDLSQLSATSGLLFYFHRNNRAFSTKPCLSLKSPCFIYLQSLKLLNSVRRSKQSILNQQPPFPQFSRPNVVLKINFDCNLIRRLMLLFFFVSICSSARKISRVTRRSLNEEISRVDLKITEFKLTLKIRVGEILCQTFIVDSLVVRSSEQKTSALLLYDSFKAAMQVEIRETIKIPFKQNLIRCNIGTESTRFFYPMLLCSSFIFTDD